MDYSKLTKKELIDLCKSLEKIAKENKEMAERAVRVATGLQAQSFEELDFFDSENALMN